VFAYIVRRLVWAVLLLIVLSMVTFSIFYLIPRLGGATPETLATRYVGRSATAETVHLTAERLGFLDPVPVQYWNWLKGIVVGADYDFGAGVEHCPAPCLGYSFITHQPVWPELLDRAPVTMSLTIGAAIIWLVVGVSIGVISALRRGTAFDRGAMGIALAGVSLPIFFTGLIALAFFSYGSPRRVARTFPSVRTRHSGRTRCCCPGSPSPFCSPPSTPG
jgi:peptide/nickel transport system permease protein